MNPDTTRPLLLFIPVYNCAAQIVRVLRKLRTFRPEYIGEILVLDNGSQDGTMDAVIEDLNHSKLQINLSYGRNRMNVGLGGSHKIAFDYGLRNGFGGVVTLHGDDQAELKDLLPAIARWRAGELQVDAILGSRFSKTSIRSGYAFHRTLGNVVLNSLWSLLVGRRITDIGSGLNFLSAKALERIDFWSLPESLVFNPQLLVALLSENLSLHFEPISWKEEDQKSNAVPAKVFVGALRQAVRYRLGLPWKQKFDRCRYETTTVFCTRQGRFIEGNIDPLQALPSATQVPN